MDASGSAILLALAAETTVLLLWSSLIKQAADHNWPSYLHSPTGKAHISHSHVLRVDPAQLIHFWVSQSEEVVTDGWSLQYYYFLGPRHTTSWTLGVYAL